MQMHLDEKRDIFEPGFIFRVRNGNQLCIKLKTQSWKKRSGWKYHAYEVRTLHTVIVENTTVSNTPPPLHRARLSLRFTNIYGVRLQNLIKM